MPKSTLFFAKKNRNVRPPSLVRSYRPDEQTGEHRLMRGMAKMRELDIRLARTTQRARDLRLLARDAQDEAERAAGKLAGEEVKTLHG